MKITLLIGLPGSGKTMLGKCLEAQGACFIDDISIVGMKVLREAIEKNDHIVVADSFLCREKERAAAEKALQGCDLEWVFFENDPDKCVRNVDKRADGRKVKGLINLLSREYTLPVGVTPRIIVG